MAEFITMQDAEDKFGSKGKANAGMVLGIIGTALATFGGSLGGILGGGSKQCDGPTAYEVQQKECADNLALTNAIWQTRVTDINEKFDLYTRLDAKITALAVKDAQLEASLPLAMQLAAVNAERYADNKICGCKSDQANVNFMLQREIDKKINGTIGLPWSDIISGIPAMPACTIGVKCPTV